MGILVPVVAEQECARWQLLTIQEVTLIMQAPSSLVKVLDRHHSALSFIPCGLWQWITAWTTSVVALLEFNQLVSVPRRKYPILQDNRMLSIDLPLRFPSPVFKQILFFQSTAGRRS